MKISQKLWALMLGLALSLSAASQAAAQQRMTPEQRAQQRVDKMKEQLNLTPDQVTKITAIYTDMAQKMKALRNSDADPQTRQQQRKDIMKNSETQVAALLTPAQIEKWKQMKAQMKEQRQGGGQPEGQPGN